MWWMVIALMCALVSQAAADDKANLAAARKILDRQFVGDLDWAPPMTKDHFGVVPGHFSDGEIINWPFGPPYIGKLELSVAGNKEKELVSGDLGVAFAEVDLLVNETSRRLRAIVVAKKVDTGWEVAALAFGTDTPVGDPTIP